MIEVMRLDWENGRRYIQDSIDRPTAQPQGGESANKGLCQWHDDHRCTCERSTASQAATYVPREYTHNLSQSTSMH